VKLIKNDKKTMARITGELKDILTKYHSILESQPKGEILEEILSRALHNAGVKSDWRPDCNHVIGKDLTLESSGERISIKTGKVKVWKTRPNRNLTISGSRLTSHPSLSEKIKFLSHKKEDSYMLLTSCEGDSRGSRIYELITFHTSLLDYENAPWHTRNHSKSGPNYECETNDFKAKIQSAMSDQLWTEIKDYDKNSEISVYKMVV